MSQHVYGLDKAGITDEHVQRNPGCPSADQLSHASRKTTEESLAYICPSECRSGEVGDRLPDMPTLPAALVESATPSVKPNRHDPDPAQAAACATRCFAASSGCGAGAA